MSFSGRIAVLLACAGFAGPSLLAGCQEGGPKVFHVGVLCGFEFFCPIADGFKEKMAQLGYLEGKNIVYDVRKSGTVDMAEYRQVLEHFVADKMDLIFVFPTEASIEAKAAAREANIPVLFANAFIEDTHLVNSVREPGGNITGVRWVGPDLALQRLEIMRELVPQAKVIWVPHLKGYPIVKSQVEALQSAGATAGMRIVPVPATSAAELTAQFARELQSSVPPDAILTIAEPFAIQPDAFIVIGKFAEAHKIPIGGALFSAGGYESVFGLTPQSIPQGKQAASLADKILKGTPAGTIPIASAESYFELNCKTARTLGLNVSEALLSRAERIIR